jgi:hypothetical protein
MHRNDLVYLDFIAIKKVIKRKDWFCTFESYSEESNRCKKIYFNIRDGNEQEFAFTRSVVS